MSVNELLNIASPDYICLTPAFYEALHEAVTGGQQPSMGAVVGAALKVAKLPHGDKEIPKACARLLQEQEEAVVAKEKSSPGKPPAAGDGQGTSLVAWLGKMDLRKICYLISEFNPIKAKSLYFEADASLVAECFALRSEYEMECGRLQYEATLYGFGGKYDTDKGGDDVKTHDLTKGANNKSALNSLRSLGF